MEIWGDVWQLELLDENVVGGMFGVLLLLKKYIVYEEYLKNLNLNNIDYNLWMWEYWIKKFNCSWDMEGLMNSIYSCVYVRERELYVYKIKYLNMIIICLKYLQVGFLIGDLLFWNKYINVMDVVYVVVYVVKNILDCKDRGSFFLDVCEKCFFVDEIILNDILKFLKNVFFEGRFGL